MGAGSASSAATGDYRTRAGSRERERRGVGKEREVVESRGFDSEKAVPAPDEAGRRDGDGRK